MKGLDLLFAAIVFVASAQGLAQAQVSNSMIEPQELQGIYQLCDAHKRNDFHSECIDIVASSTFVTQALSVCSRHQYSGPLNQCLSIIKNASFDSRALRTCNRMTRKRPLNKCLSIISGVNYKGSDLMICNQHRTANRINDCLNDLGDNKPFWETWVWEQ